MVDETFYLCRRKKIISTLAAKTLKNLFRVREKEQLARSITLQIFLTVDGLPMVLRETGKS